MKKDSNGSRKRTYDYNSNEKSIETAVQYLVDESLRLNDIKGAGILRKALVEYRNKNSAQTVSDYDERYIISFIRQFLALADDQQEHFLEYLERKTH